MSRSFDPPLIPRNTANRNPQHCPDLLEDQEALYRE